MIENVKTMFGMDSNFFYPMVAAIPIPLLQFIHNIFLNNKNRSIKKMLQLHCKRENNNFYIYIMFIEIAIVLFSIYGSVFLCIGIETILLFMGCKLELKVLLIVMLYGTISIATSLKVIKMTWVRKRILGDQKGKNIILCSAFFINIAIACEMFNRKLYFIEIIFMLLYLVNEVVGLCHFGGRYIKYEYSSIKLYINSGECIVCENIENVRVKKDYIIVEIEERNIILQYDMIWKVEYYGPHKYIVLENTKKI